MVGGFWSFVLYERLKRCCLLYDSGLEGDVMVHLLVLMGSHCFMMRHLNMLNNMMVWSVGVFSRVVLHWLMVRVVGIVSVSFISPAIVSVAMA